MTQNIVAGIFERAKAARAKGKAAYSRSGIGVNPIKQKKGMSLRVSIRKNTRAKSGIKPGDRVHLAFDNATERMTLTKETLGYFTVAQNSGIQFAFEKELVELYPFLKAVKASRTYDATDLIVKKGFVEFGIMKPEQISEVGTLHLSDCLGTSRAIGSEVHTH